jgi:aspartate oxidase
VLGRANKDGGSTGKPAQIVLCLQDPAFCRCSLAGLAVLSERPDQVRSLIEEMLKGSAYAEALKRLREVDERSAEVSLEITELGVHYDGSDEAALITEGTGDGDRERFPAFHHRNDIREP